MAGRDATVVSVAAQRAAVDCRCGWMGLTPYYDCYEIWTWTPHRPHSQTQMHLLLYYVYVLSSSPCRRVWHARVPRLYAVREGGCYNNNNISICSQGGVLWSVDLEKIHLPRCPMSYVHPSTEKTRNLYTTYFTIFTTTTHTHTLHSRIIPRLYVYIYIRFLEVISWSFVRV